MIRRITILAALPFICCATWSRAQSNDVSTAPVRLPAVEVTGTNMLQEELPMGPYNEPEWVARRPFGITRVYVHPPWQMETEFSWDRMYDRGGSPQDEIQQEFELGLPYRFQIDYEIHGANFVDAQDVAGPNRWCSRSRPLELRRQRMGIAMGAGRLGQDHRRIPL
jgi:hypothetical protein